MERLTASNTGMQLNVALSFSGKGDIASAARAIARLAAAGKLDPESVDESVVESHLALAPVLESVGPPDLLIRTSGESRMSFMGPDPPLTPPKQVCALAIS
jgi:undecaprenyl diphosphate synthase